MSLVTAYLERHRQDLLADLGTLVERESPSTEKSSLDEVARFLAGLAEDRTGGAATILPQAEAGDHVRLLWGAGANGVDGSGGILLAGHFDTVWPLGTLASMPFEIADGRARGPGVFDMKAGLVQGLWALRALRETGTPAPPVTFLLTSDEETGSFTSRSLLEEEARRASLSMILEPSFQGALKTARKGTGDYRLQVTGRASHAGSEPFAGISAIDEICRLALAVHAETNAATGTTLNVGVIEGGTRANVVAAHAAADVDVRVTTMAEAQRLDGFFRGLRPRHPEAVLEVAGGLNRPPMERTERVAELFAFARRVGAEIGLELDEASVGGGSDGNFCAAANPAVLDGLGAVGDGAHAASEHVVVDALAPRASLLAHLLAGLASR
jgi:glutamate carboxypeptidase